jgi:type II secretory pathway component GspD/PulD (secretin)
VTATNQQRVFISVVNQRAYIADYELGGGATGLVAAEIADPVVRNFQEGIVLDVRPVVSSDRKYITIDVRPTVATLVGQTISTVIVNLGTTMAAAINSPIEIPEIQLQQTMTTVTIPDGGTILLGGLQERTYRKYVSTTPILGAVPFLKLLFTRTAEVDERRHLLVLLTGKIILLRDMEEEKFGTGKEY